MASRTGKLRNRGRIARKYEPESVGTRGGIHCRQRLTHRVFWNVITNDDAATIDGEHVALATGDPFFVACESGHDLRFLERCERRELELIDEATNSFRFPAPTCAAQNAQLACGSHAKGNRFAMQELIIR